MRLQKIRVHGFKRFGEPVELVADGKLTAVVGPNEAGKTSLLRAIEHLTSGDDFVASGGSRDFTRDTQPKKSQAIVQALFHLDDDDRAAVVSDVRDSSQIRWYKLTVQATGNLTHELIPPLHRDLKPRKRVLGTLGRIESRQVVANPLRS